MKSLYHSFTMNSITDQTPLHASAPCRALMGCCRFHITMPRVAHVWPCRGLTSLRRPRGRLSVAATKGPPWRKARKCHLRCRGNNMSSGDVISSRLMSDPSQDKIVYPSTFQFVPGTKNHTPLIKDYHMCLYWYFF